MILPNKWNAFLDNERENTYFLKLQKFVANEYITKTIYPEPDNIFRAFELVAPADVKVVIIGQDPYHGRGQAHGLAFSVLDDSKVPPSLRNIYKELSSDLNCAKPKNGNLTSWAKEGVLLINSVLTVEEGSPNSHKNRGWEIFTDKVIAILSAKEKNIVFILWGGPSQKKEKFIDTSEHLVLKASHPSPLSAYRGFFGSKPFSKTNEYLKNCNLTEIEWCLSGQGTLL